MYQTKTFPSGMRLIVEHMQNYESVSFNMFVNTGSTSEDDTNRGISHFIEHMLFKGTKKRSAVEIVTRLDAIGATVNAFTSKKETVYYTKSTKESLPECVDILSDMYFNSIFDEKEMTREKKVVVEEIAMYNDNPAAVADELASRAFYEGTPMQHDIAGSKTSVRSITREKIDKYLSEHYLPQNLILSFAGNITMDEAIEFAQNYFESKFTTKNEPNVIKTPDVLTLPKTRYVKKFKDNEQAQIVVAFPGINLHDPRYYELNLFNTIWGSGMSSRLFQIIREKLGLVYSVYSNTESSNYGGSVSIYLGTTVKNIKVAITALKKAIETIIKEGITQEELESAKTNLINTLKLRYENTAYVSLYHAKMMSHFNKSFEKEEVIRSIEQVTKEQVNKLIEHIYAKNNYVISMVGKDVKTNLLKCFQTGKI
jgi:predicted Zn-dependent peptidase